MVQQMKSYANDLMQWQAYKNGLKEKIEEIKQDIADKTEDERIILKTYRKNLNVANWKIDQLFSRINEIVESKSEMDITITLDDFDIEGKSLDYELAAGEMKQVLEDKKKAKKD